MKFPTTPRCLSTVGLFSLRFFENAGMARRRSSSFLPIGPCFISDGWAAPFQKLTAEVPIVARLFSRTACSFFTLFSSRDQERLFPLNRLLKSEYRTLINDAVFHGGTVAVEQDQQHAKRLKLTHGKSQLPFMTWTAGQREFTPLLLGLYHLLPPRRLVKQPDIEWVVIEEPEMGLHPQAISIFMLLVLDLLWLGYCVGLSTHSPLVLTVVWMLRRLSEKGARWQLICWPHPEPIGPR